MPPITPLAVGLCLLGASAACCAQDVMISEFMASNQDTIDDVDGDSSDWIELFNAGAAAVDLDGWTLSDDPAALTKWRFPAVSLAPGEFLVVFASDKNRRDPAGELHTNFKLSAGGEYLALVGPGGTTIEHEFSPSYPPQITDVSYGPGGYFTAPTPGASNGTPGDQPGPLVRNVPETIARPAPGGMAPAVVADSVTDFSGNQGKGGWFYGYYDASNDSSGGGYDPALDFTPFPGGASSGGWSDSNFWTGTIWDFNPAGAGIGNPPFTTLTASSAHPTKANPDEHHVVRRWVSDVSGMHTITGSFTNVSPNGDGTTGRIYHQGVEIFAALSDGDTQSVNLQVTLSVGDVIDFVVDDGPADNSSFDSTSTTFQISGGGSAGAAIDFPITAEIAATANPVAGVVLSHRVMYGDEVDVAMVDDGSGDDAAAGDGIYTGTISTPQLVSGQMLRWRVVATDTAGNLTSAPPGADPLDSPEYFGTVALDASTDTSKLPVLHWFASDPGGANTRAGSRSSAYFLGEFYDNILTDLHGQSTANFAKKSYDFDFNSGDRFLWKVGERRVKDVNLLTNWADKSKLRNTLAYEVLRDAGAPYHFAFPVRVQQNGVFFSTADMVEDGDDRMLERNGLDPDGAFYKIYNSLQSTALANKKTRQHEGDEDLQALIDGLGQSGDAKQDFGYDNINLPAAVNYHAAIAIYANRDHGHKNYYVYRDTEGSGEWFPIAWDVDLSFGRNFKAQGGYFVDTLDGGINDLTPGAGNRLYSLIYNTPALRAMYHRRIRTLADEILEAPGTVGGKLEARIGALLDRIDPPGILSDADLDYSRWGSWGNNNNAALAGQRIIDEFLDSPGGTGRRDYLYTTLSGTIPTSQPAMAPVAITMGEFNPASGNQEEEYFTLSHSNSYDTDVSGWQIDGAVRLEIPAGTVIPVGTTLHVGRDAVAFRARANSPRGGERRFLISGYGGQLSARGETIELYDGLGNLIDSLTYPGAPTDMQNWLRITELMYHPADPSTAELAADASLTASDFEFIELRNTGPAPLDISGAQFVAGIAFTFPATTTLAAGESVIVVSNSSALALRYGEGLGVAGEFIGQLDNSGEEIQLVDDVGENILEFSYSDDWYWPTDGTGHSLAVLDAGAGFGDWNLPDHWGISEAAGGTPGSEETGFATIFSIWQGGQFTSEELLDPSVSGADADFDGDGLTTLVEYGLVLSAKEPDAPGATALVVSLGEDDFLALNFRRQARAVDLDYTVEVCADLDGWSPATVIHGEPIDHGDGTETVTFRDTVPMGTAVTRFIRVRMILSPGN